MKILAPACSAAEASLLVSAGAEELYCGLHPAGWRSKYGQDVWLNRRGPGRANVESLEDLERLAGTAHSRGVPVYLALNLPFYDPGLLPGIVNLAVEAAGRGVDAFIIGDPGLIMAVRAARTGAAIHVSSLAAVLNSFSAAFFRDLGASRIIFPRYTGLDDIRLIAGRVGRGVEYEVFILNDGCVYEEGFCHVSHAFGGAFCHQPWKFSLAGEMRGSPAGESFARHMIDYREWTWCVRNCGGGPGPGGYPLGMCGLCALPDLNEIGVHSLKIVGREAPLQKKIASVRLLKKVLDMVEAGEAPCSVRHAAIRTRGVPALCRSGFMCYYRN